MLRRLTYLPHKFTVLLFFFLILGIVLSGFSFWILSIPSIFLLYISRRTAVTLQNTTRIDGEIFISPISGKIEKLDLSGNKLLIKIKMSLLDGWGFHLPLNSEMKYLKIKEGILLTNENQETRLDMIDKFYRTEIELTSEMGLNYQLYCFHPTPTRLPKIWMKSGDKGAGAACFGYFPFGGWVFVVLPKNSDLLVIENEHIVAGESVLAVIKEY